MLPPNFNNQQTVSQNDTVTINGYEYLYSVILYNGHIAINIPIRMIRELVIKDNIYSIFHNGHIVLKNDFSNLENYTTQDLPSSNQDILKTSYNFNSKLSSDLIVIKIKPKLPPSNQDRLSDDDWGLTFIFSIYDEEEMYNPIGSEKLKIFKFRDIKEDMLSSIQLPWSTSEIVKLENKTTVSQFTNANRSVKTGNALKNIISTTLDGFNCIFDSDWDIGNTSIFYSLPYGQTRFDGLEYILDLHISSKSQDNCILRYERNNTWTLIPVEQYFKRALDKKSRLPGDFIIDIFNLNLQNHIEGNENTKIPPKSKLSYDIRLPLDEFTGLTNYGFLNTASMDSTAELVSTPVHTYNHSKKQFLIDLTDTNILNVQSKYQQMYINNMYGDNPTNNIPVDDTKLSNFMFHPVFSLQEGRHQRLKHGRNRLFSKALAFCPGLTFNIEGITIRRAGRFISIINTGQFPDTAFQNTLQGEWFATEVTHVFTGNIYRNEITCIKPYTYTNLNN